MRVDGWVAIEGPYLFRGPDGPASLSQLPSFTTVALAVPSNCPAPRNSSVNLTNGHGDAVSWYHGPLWKLTGGVQLVVNMQTSVAGFVAIELQGENGLVLPGYSLDEADKLKGNALDAVASWRNGSLASLSLLVGTNVSVRAVLPSAKLFSIKLACADASKTDDTWASMGTGSDFSRQPWGLGKTDSSPPRGGFRAPTKWMSRHAALLLPSANLLRLSAAPASDTGVISVLDHGAVADNRTDNRAAFAKALNASTQGRASVVVVPAGLYHFACPLSASEACITVPAGVTLMGEHHTAPISAWSSQSVLLPVYDRLPINETQALNLSAPFVSLQQDAAFAGLAAVFPQMAIGQGGATATLLPWAISLDGDDCTVVDTFLLNPFAGIASKSHGRHTIRNVLGQPMRMGIFVKDCYDVGRIEDVHFCKPAAFSLCAHACC